MFDIDFDEGVRAAAWALTPAWRELINSCCELIISSRNLVAGVGARSIVSRMLEGSSGWPGIRVVPLPSRSDGLNRELSSERVVA